MVIYFIAFRACGIEDFYEYGNIILCLNREIQTSDDIRIIQREIKDLNNFHNAVILNLTKLNTLPNDALPGETFPLEILGN